MVCPHSERLCGLQLEARTPFSAQRIKRRAAGLYVHGIDATTGTRERLRCEFVAAYPGQAVIAASDDDQQALLNEAELLLPRRASSLEAAERLKEIARLLAASADGEERFPAG